MAFAKNFTEKFARKVFQWLSPVGLVCRLNHVQENHILKSSKILVQSFKHILLAQQDMTETCQTNL